MVHVRHMLICHGIKMRLHPGNHIVSFKQLLHMW